MDDLLEIKTGNGTDRDLAATTNDRLKKAVIELRDLNTVIGTLDTDLKGFSRGSDKWSKGLFYLTLVLVIFTIVTVVLTAFLIIDAREQTASQNNISLSALFFNTDNTGIIDAIENARSILVEDHGKYTDAQLDNYLGSFDTVETALDSHLLDESDFCDSFSYFIGITVKDAEIQKYIAEQQQTDHEYYSSLRSLANNISNSSDRNCKQSTI